MQSTKKFDWFGILKKKEGKNKKNKKDFVVQSLKFWSAVHLWLEKILIASSLLIRTL